MQIVLDIDDTLYLERDYVRSGFKAVDKWLKANRDVNGFMKLSWDYFLKGMRNDIFNRVLRDINRDDVNLVAQMVEVYRTHEPNIHLLPDAQFFFDNHVKSELAIISDGYPATQWAKVRSLKLENLVAKILITGDWGCDYWKPHPRAFKILQRGHSPDDCVYIADNPQKDFIAPEKLGWMPSIRVRRKGSLYEGIPTPQTCIEIRTLNQIPHF